jgi:hypothetical protein
VRNGNRWRVDGIDEKTNRIAAERLTDKARVVFEATICVSMYTSATPSPCAPRKASPPTPHTPSSLNLPAGPWPTWP